MEIRGKVHEISKTQNVTDKFKKRDLVIAYAENPKFVDYIKFEATQDRVNIFDNLNVGDDVEVSFNLRGRPFTNKEGITTYFNSLVAWRVTNITNTVKHTQSTGEIVSSGDEDDDLPF